MAAWIGVDLDGTLSHYTHWDGSLSIGKPVPSMVLRVKTWRKDGHEVRIFTARAQEFETRPEVKRFVEAWCLVHLGEVLPITNVKDYEMTELWDDRAVAVQQNTGEYRRWL